MKATELIKILQKNPDALICVQYRFSEYEVMNASLGHTNRIVKKNLKPKAIKSGKEIITFCADLSD